MFDNFVRIHQTLKVTPAMAAGVTEEVWEISDVVALLEPKEGNIAKLRNNCKDAKFGPVMGR